MVHALLESWRVLEAGGVLIDLRPYHSNPAVEIMTAGEVFVAGNVDDAPGAPDDIAADEAIAEAVGRRFFSPEVRDSFLYAYYWHSLEGMLAYAAEKWQFSEIPTAVVERGRRFLADYEGPYRIRLRRRLHLRTYRKRPVAHPHFQR